MASAIAAPASGPSPATVARLRQQATELEGVFLHTLMKEMFASIRTDESAMGGGFAEQTWRGMQAEQFADAMARTGGIGLADAILGDLLALQEGASSPHTTGANR
ncbi:MAG TPA: flagellar biosynthesis protein FlgJ [Alphaproteobacteria bacterium]|nr:flagellar biosynthesis protein FlgJ [Alphaproteobacteria bacterium]